MLNYEFVAVTLDRAHRTASLVVHGPNTHQPETPEEFVAAGDRAWALKAFRELDDALLRLRLNEPEMGTVHRPDRR